MDIHDVIRKPLFTEKGTALKESANKILIEVDRKANKIEIKTAVEKMFNVKVEGINTVNVKPKKRMRGRIPGRTAASKKAIVTLKKGEKLDFIEGV
ncbi:50S ribosomal protein L23 [bacterium BMS3Abin07]|nr:50S ribosomal protein L23 [bacterium BMS3Abin07]GBE33385.1 50S ribosomal protein L23 [bacterium BMS3Bbin05]HDL20433.1 50S ribosomal protein L23 [Nitrospirota bacterium]HDO21936.1 50S ribosomal protein L23 [Nitrospirota bacterium]HDZ87734.1 50S ribosomal protein L23 [Nitrospirota bacterium]